MLRRTLLTAFAATAALPGLGLAQTGDAPPQQRQAPPPIVPENELERVFLAALTDESARPEFRRLLMTSRIVLAMTNNEADSPPLQMTFGAVSPALIFTSETRQSAVLGPASARRILTGRQAFALLRGKHAVINFMHTPMLTLDPPDIAQYLAQ